MSYIDTLIVVATDCPIGSSEIPVAKKEKKPAHLIQYELLMERPYTLDHEGLTYEVFVRQKEFSQETLRNEGKAIWENLFSKGHPCMRASSLTKRYGFGAHYNHEGKIAIYPMESREYKALMDDDSVKKIAAMKSKR